MNRCLFVSAALLLLACDPAEPVDAEVSADGEVAQAVENDSPRRQSSAAATPKSKVGKAGHGADPAAVMPQAKVAFGEVVELLEQHYVDGALEDDALWTGAASGVLERLVQLEQHPINVLMPPEHLHELDEGTSGKIVGIGVAIEMLADVLVVREVIADSPSERAGLQAGDRVLAVDGERTKGAELKALVYKIRGEIGSTVELFVQRETEEWTVEIERGEVKFSSVEGRMLDDVQGYLRVSSFAERTAEDVDSELEKLRDQGMKSLVLDLRGCPGGLLDAAVDVADRFLAVGLAIASVSKRGDEETRFAAKHEYPWQSLPLVVLIGPKTASGAEVLALALSDHDRATLVGDPTLGKGTVESVHELSNGWGLKLSTGRFFGPNHDRKHGEPVEPDLRIPGSGDKPPKSVKSLDLEGDAALVAARQLLRVRGG